MSFRRIFKRDKQKGDPVTPGRSEEVESPSSKTQPFGVFTLHNESSDATYNIE
jgi:hypothetical protein